MTADADVLAREIRRAIAELVDAAPLPPPLRLRASAPARRQPRRGSLAVPIAALAAVVTVVLVTGTVALTRTHDGGRTAVSSGGGEQGGPAPIGPASLPDYTMVVPDVLPAGLQYNEGGTRTAMAGTPQIVLAAGDGRSAHIFWTKAACGRPSPVTTTAQGGQPSGPPIVLTPTAAGAVWVGVGVSRSLQWCLDGTTTVVVRTEKFDEPAARALAAAIVRVGADPADLTVAVPDGFTAARSSAPTAISALTYSSPSGARLSVRVQAAWTTDVDLLKADAAGETVNDVRPDGHPGFGGRMPGGGAQYVTLVYDDHTLVTLTGTGMSTTDLLRTAASLRPADRSVVAPDVAGDQPRCVRLGFCG